MTVSSRVRMAVQVPAVEVSVWIDGQHQFKLTQLNIWTLNFFRQA